MDPWPQLLTRLARVVTAPESAALPVRLAQAFADITGLDGVALTLGISPTERAVACATDDLAEKLEDAQDLLHEGPSLDAQRTGQPVGPVSLLHQRERWPMLSQHFETSQDDLVIYAFPMAPQGESLGVLQGHQATTRPLGLRIPEAVLLADAIGIALAGGLQGNPDPVETQWRVRDHVFQATGMVMAQLGLSPSDALAVLRAHAFATTSPLSQVCEAVVARRLDFSTDPDIGEDR